MADAVHRYLASATWTGTTSVGYDRYEREHRAAVTSTATGAPVTTMALSGDVAFGGDAAVANPEQLVVVAASSCQLLSFLAVAARARIDVVSYHDDAEAEMPEDDRPVRLTLIRLRPRIVVRGPATDARLAHLVEVAHRECFIANSLTTTIVIDPRFERWAG